MVTAVDVLKILVTDMYYIICFVRLALALTVVGAACIIRRMC